MQDEKKLNQEIGPPAEEAGHMQCMDTIQQHIASHAADDGYYNERSSTQTTPSRAQGVGMDFFGDLKGELVRGGGGARARSRLPCL